MSQMGQVKWLLALGSSSCVVAGCGSAATTSGSNRAAGTTGASNRATTSQPGTPSTSTVAQLGCHQYCREAGGYGAGPGEAKPAMRVLTNGPVRLLPNGSVPVTLRCQLPSPCRGAILVDAEPVCSIRGGIGRSDLAVDPGSIRTIAVPLSSCLTLAVQTRGRVSASVTADSGQSPECHSAKIDCVNPGSIMLRRSS
jgi:hypothetical protein